MEYSDQKRKGLFKGTALDYVRMRADKHEKVYKDKKQADHLRKLADELEQNLPVELIKKVKNLETKTELIDKNVRALFKNMEFFHFTH